MKYSIGSESIRLKRDASNATRRALFFSSSVAGFMPRIFCWFGQMIAQTLNSMIVPSHAPMPMPAYPLASVNAVTKCAPSSAAPASQVTTADQRKYSRARGATCRVMPAAVLSAVAALSAGTWTKLK